MAETAKKSSDNHQNKNQPDMPDIMNIMAEVFEQTKPLVENFIDIYNFDYSEDSLDPMHLYDAYMEFMNHLLSDPEKLMDMQLKYWQDWTELCQKSASRYANINGDNTAPLYSPDKGDRRFRSEAWKENALFDFIKQSYLLTSKWMEEAVRGTDGIDSDTRTKVEYFTRQFINAISPSNFLFTNPDAIQATLDSGGENLVKGMENLLRDLKRGHGKLKISTTDYDAFEVGQNLAITKGSVIYQNDLMQLIQYEALTDKVHKRPLLIIPPWINKYYILDMREDNSFIRWLLEQGHNVFVISWVNPDNKLAKKRFEDYMSEGVLKAMEQIEKVTEQPDCNALGYCLGGTLLAITLSWLAAKNKGEKIASATFLTSLTDFENSGEIKLFMDDCQLALIDKDMAEKGVLKGDVMRNTFSMLRSNDLIWSFVVNNYLMGQELFPFDLLYWNEDATNMPAAMHSFYIRKLYKENLLAVPDGITMHGTPINLGKVKTPCYVLSAQEDHIAPWKATYALTQLISGNATFTLAASGHVAGVVNPPSANKYHYMVSENTPEDPEEWMLNSTQHSGSWWPHWNNWENDFTGEKVSARKIGGNALKPIESAPGSYVKRKSD
jgi:polyhydroxyalkanoate synthase